MFKKFSVFVDSGVRQAVSGKSNRESKLRVGDQLSTCFSVIHELVVACSLSHQPFGSQVVHPHCEKLFTIGNHGYDQLRDAYSVACRIEAVISFLPDDALSLRIYFFGRGFKESFLACFFHILNDFTSRYVGGSSRPDLLKQALATTQ